MVYLAIKELAGTAEDVIMDANSIMKGMQPGPEVISQTRSGPYAGLSTCVSPLPDLRLQLTLQVHPPSIAQGFEGFSKIAAVEKTTSTCSATPASSCHLFLGARDIVGRWANGLQDTANTESSTLLFGRCALVGIKNGCRWLARA